MSLWSELDRRAAISARQEAFRKAEIWRRSAESDHDPAIAGKRERERQPTRSPQYDAEQMKAARKALGMEE
jgi:hypothetical protein